MLNAYERQLVLFYLSNAASRFHNTYQQEALASWVTDNRDILALADENEVLSDLWEHREKKLSARDWKVLREIIKKEYAAARKKARKDRIARQLQRLGREMDLAPADLALVELWARSETQPIFTDLSDSLESGRRYHHRHRFFNTMHPVLPCLLGLSDSAFRARFAANAPLVKSGLVFVEQDGDIEVVRRLLRLFSVPDGRTCDVCSLLLDAAPPGELEWSDFDHVAEKRDHIEKLVKGALTAGKPGVNILVYGPPGTGKTEFCKTLAAQLEVNLYSVGEEDERGCDPNRRERLQELRLAQHLLAPSRKSILLFDEMEDLLSDPAGWFPFASFGRLRSNSSKVFLNRLLERAPVPTLWTSNSARETDHALLRRMSFALELRQPPPKVRARIWQRELARHHINATAEDAQALAQEFDVTPGVASSAIASASLCDGDLATVRLGIRSLSQVINGEKPPANQEPPEKFDLALVRADIDPVSFADRIAKSGGKHFSLCMQGPPGTGKSAFVRYLSERLGLQVTQKRASDLMSMWVGQTEQRIADAFAEARAEGTILVFDEADSLLAARRDAVRSWEVSQVNEMLTWMESHPLPFACTTNFGENLDPATLRRFTFKIALDYLTPDQSQAAFRTYFALEAPPEIGDLATLTPGDFAVVRRKAEILGHLQDAEALAGLLCAECEAKPNYSRKTGF